jgi:malto-oligosyltrehalose synthase/4-alpha-glucanotransferase
MYKPASTYRVQFHKGFNFESFEKTIPYFVKLGVSTIYASPIFEAVPGSQHGYDIIDPHKINPEIGTLDQLRNIARKLAVHGIGWIQDIVPNHMAFHSANNWLMDVLEKGRYSVYASFFDMSWTSDLFQGRVIVPVLGASLDEIIQSNELQLEYSGEKITLRYHDHVLPLHPRSYNTVFQREDIPQAVQQVTEQISTMHRIEEPVAYNLRWHELIIQLQALQRDDRIREFITQAVQHINETPHLLKQIASEQQYTLAPWQRTDEKINFRRFFTINNLIGLNMQNEKVFHQYHKFIRTLLDENLIQGLRIDHIDGLYDPTQYLERLREFAGDHIYIVVEKILQQNENLPAWPVQGTTGYDFLATVNNLMMSTKSDTLSIFYRNLTNDKRPVEEHIREKKSHILYQHMNGELENLSRLLTESSLINKEQLKSVSYDNLKEAIGEFLINFPVYRFYDNTLPLSREASESIHTIFDQVRERKPSLSPAVHVLEDVLLKKDATQEIASDFYRRCMQFTGPLMAKGVEDTLMYTYNRLIGKNEVGDSPEMTGITSEGFHETMKARQSNWPLTMNATSTHDTKRGEEVRMRIAVLAELADEWAMIVKEWIKVNAELKPEGYPDVNDEYFIYQSIVGAYPFETDDTFGERLEQYLIKAIREGKTNSDWATPNEEYERASTQFANRILEKGTPFRRKLKRLQETISDYAIVNSLAQVVLKFTCPGVPDVYQGCELWDLSFVDPDNRRAVDYTKRKQWLDEICAIKQEQLGNEIAALWKERKNGKIKEWLTSQLFRVRHHCKDLFLEGEYVPLEVDGMYKTHILAYGRKYKQHWIVTVVPLHVGSLCTVQKRRPNSLLWKDTRVLLPSEAPDVWKNVFTKRTGRHHSSMHISEIFKEIPVAVLKLEHHDRERTAGILMHITSLPSSFGVGDLGPAAYTFVDFLKHARQTYWQILPLSPTSKQNFHSPYSTHSAMAGNALLISPEMLVGYDLLSKNDIVHLQQPVTETADFEAAQQIRIDVFKKSWERFRSSDGSDLHKKFQEFITAENHWLHDYAMFILLKKHHSNAPWHEWISKYKMRDEQALREFTEKNQQEIHKIKWEQFIFDCQWTDLRTYCAAKEIKLMGDLPFYMVYDSVDVWVNPDIFSLDDNLNPTHIAGVPPDYFNSNGQLWGMPVYNWDRLKERGYDWWIQRLRKNMQYFDLLRLDHFRALADYWSVPADEKTAVNGEWKKGPGIEFMEAVQRELGSLPFIAEDLGDINQDVHTLRDQFNLPGMKVLQFAFGDDLASSEYAPHNFKGDNYFVYTGTHDNNTTHGWYKHELTREQREKFNKYVGHDVRERSAASELMRIAYGSIAKVAIIPMQDVIGLSRTYRMNNPGSIENNWLWRMTPDQIELSMFNDLVDLTRLFNR